MVQAVGAVSVVTPPKFRGKNLGNQAAFSRPLGKTAGRPSLIPCALNTNLGLTPVSPRKVISGISAEK